MTQKKKKKWWDWLGSTWGHGSCALFFYISMVVLINGTVARNINEYGGYVPVAANSYNRGGEVPAPPDRGCSKINHCHGNPGY